MSLIGRVIPEVALSEQAFAAVSGMTSRLGSVADAQRLAAAVMAEQVTLAAQTRSLVTGAADEVANSARDASKITAG
jgi:hypothetical protein